ncbi:MAG: Rab family GTPase [Candidatus Odinarchaeota archaeon]
MKICLLGEGAVGKTSLRQRYLGEKFSSNYQMTIGADFAVKTVEKEDLVYRFQVWDLAGQESFSSIRDLFYKGALGALIVFDMTRPETLPILEKWIDGFYKHNDKAPLILLGNKSDLKSVSEHVVKDDEINGFIKQLEKRGVNVPYFETSAVSGQNVEEAFLLLGDRILDAGRWEREESVKWSLAKSKMKNG